MQPTAAQVRRQEMARTAASAATGERLPAVAVVAAVAGSSRDTPATPGNEGGYGGSGGQPNGTPGVPGGNGGNGGNGGDPGGGGSGGNGGNGGSGGLAGGAQGGSIYLAGGTLTLSCNTTYTGSVTGGAGAAGGTGGAGGTAGNNGTAAGGMGGGGGKGTPAGSTGTTGTGTGFISLAPDGEPGSAGPTSAPGSTTGPNLSQTGGSLIIEAPPVVATGPLSQTIASGHPVTFTASATGTPAPTVQWQVSTNHGGTFTNIPGATSTTLSFITNVGENGDQYRAVFTNSQGHATTLAATLTVTAAPQITLNPVSQTIVAGHGVTFTAAATGTPAPTVQWQVSTNHGGTFVNIPGANSTTYSFTTSTGQTGNQYRAVFTNSTGQPGHLGGHADGDSGSQWLR